MYNATRVTFGSLLAFSSSVFLWFGCAPVDYKGGCFQDSQCRLG